jgi:uncharacterized protein (DUF302 family)
MIMKKNLIYGLIGAVVGLLLTLFVIYLSAENVMMKEKDVNLSFEEAVELLKTTANAKGWSIPTVHDLQATMAKHGHQVNKVKVFELCHPGHANKVLQQDKERLVTSMMPCRVSIYEKSNGKVYVSWMNTGLMGSLMGGVVPEVMKDASRESEEIINVLLSK